MKRLSLVGFLLSSIVMAAPRGCDFPGEPPSPAGFTASAWATGLDRPVKMLWLPGGERAWVIEQPGRIQALGRDGQRLGLVVDIRDRVTTLLGSNDERGLLGLALHPSFSTNRRLFLNYTTKPPLRTRVSEFRARENGTVDPASERVVIEISQPFSNHNGGEIAFGPDGNLYIGMGDGGSGGDPQGNAQNLSSLLGKMLRIAVDGAAPYDIPADNPVFPSSSARREIFSYGLRNPWRFSFDAVTGLLWAGDVGQSQWEEIDIVEKGKNYGWNPVEGRVCYLDPDCDPSRYAGPVHVYPRSEGYSVTGGFVYRGNAFPELVGHYLFGDFGSGKIWSLPVEGGEAQQIASATQISAFALGPEGDEIFVLSLSGGISRLSRSPSGFPGSFPRLLSQTGCFASLSPLVPHATLLPYTVNSPLWSDGAAKQRFLRLPQGETVRFHSDAPWEFPTGAVLVKHFSANTVENGQSRERHLETRFLVKRADGFRYYTYRWNDSQTDASWIAGAQIRPLVLSENGASIPVDYRYPSPSDCRRCHTMAAGEALGTSTAQMNRDDGGANQLERWNARGIFSPGSFPGIAGLSELVDYRDSTQSFESRARSLLQSQCAHCHRPDNPAAQSPMDLRAIVSFSAMGICDREPLHGSLGIAGVKLLAPGDEERSLIFVRYQSLNPRHRMPPLASGRVDEVGLRALEGWIGSITGCR